MNRSTLGFIGLATATMSLAIALHSCHPTPSARFDATGAYAIDGDTFVKDGVHYRLELGDGSGDYPDAPEMPGHCRRGRDCTPGDPYQARLALQDILDTPAECDADGEDYYRRTLASCHFTVAGRTIDVGEAMIVSGLARKCHYFSSVRKAVCQ